MRQCRVCDRFKPITDFREIHGTNKARRRLCRRCEGAQKAAANRPRAERNRRKWLATDDVWAVHPTGEKQCRACRATKGVRDFARANTNLDGLQGECRQCQNDRRQVRVFGRAVTADDRCEICGIDRTPQRRLGFDHDHDTGVVRGVLCSNCNSAIGLLGDDPALIRRAAEYLETCRTKQEVTV